MSDSPVIKNQDRSDDFIKGAKISFKGIFFGNLPRNKLFHRYKEGPEFVELPPYIDVGEIVESNPCGDPILYEDILILFKEHANKKYSEFLAQASAYYPNE